MRQLLENWHEWWPFVALGLAAIVGAYFFLRKREPDPREVERQRRSYLNRVGRIVEGQVLEIVESPQASGSAAKHEAVKSPKAAGKKDAAAGAKLLYYTYSISGVTYETAQDISGLEERLHLGRAIVGKSASVKYDPANPSNSILLADDWSGLH